MSAADPAAGPSGPADALDPVALALHARRLPVSGARPLVLVSDAWHPQVNGVVHTWGYVIRELARCGAAPLVVSPQGSRSLGAPGEPGLRLSTEPRAHLRRVIGETVPAALHIATEGPLGWAARAWALERGWPFTTSYHTQFPEYLAARYWIPAPLTRAVLRRFHAPSRAVLVPTEVVRAGLERQGYGRTRVWARGVDGDRFAPVGRDALAHLPRPVFLYAGRVAREKDLDAFLSLPLPGSRVVVGDGPDRARLQRRFPDAVWLGMRPHDELARWYAAADVFVFPSRTDTFGLVLLEAMACGTPVAALPVPGPLDVVTPGVTGVLDADLGRAAMRALALDRAAVRQAALRRGWPAIAAQWIAALVAIEAPGPRTGTGPSHGSAAAADTPPAILL